MLLSLVACASSPSGIPAAIARQELAVSIPLGLDAIITVPEDNPLTQEKAALGRHLFADPLLSLDRTRSCASCHRLDAAFADSARVSPGIGGRRTTRNAPTLLNRAYGSSFFWDGRAPSLEHGVLLPIEDPNELALPMPRLLERLRADARYRARFRRAFPDGEISATTVGRALATYVRTLRSGDTPVDRYVAGDSGALTPAARHGRAVFLGKGGCADCHSGPTFTDERFHNTGIAVGTTDVGRYAVTRDSADRGRFKTPTLREIVRTAPYMHDGSLPTLERVVEFYDGGGKANANLDPDIRPLRLTAAEKSDLLAFLRALGGATTK
jgi:cytochrome c peroxidase